MTHMATPIFPMPHKQLPPAIGLDVIADMESKVALVLNKVRNEMLAPTSLKEAPLFSTAQLAHLLDVDKNKIAYRLTIGDLPPPLAKASGSKRQWTLREVRLWAQEFRKDMLRSPLVSAAATVCVANFKGGVTKTTTAATLAQGLSLRGHKVLVIDTDPQGSLTDLFGLPLTNVSIDQTILPLYQGKESSLDYAVRSTYWDGVDIVAASPVIFDAEFSLPLRQMKDPSFNFWSVLDDGLDNLRSLYDVIVIDTPPSLSYSTINSLIASDGLVMPIPPNMLDFASSAQFWRLYLDMSEPLKDMHGVDKKFSFINVLMTRVDNQEAMSSEVQRWIMSAYSEQVLPVTIPKTSIASTASAAFGTVYDVSDRLGSNKTWKRANDAYESFVDRIEEQIIGIWEHTAKGIQL